MGGRAVSPGGALLRSSRMFSIPKPLPIPASASAFLGEQKTSATMTKSQPRHQTITSPLSSRQKGDWGVKRPLPLKTTLATTTPLLRFKEIDTVENVTDFNSAADHTLSLEKFQELRIPLSVPKRQDGEATTASGRKEENLKSVFEEASDFTDIQDTSVDQRWKFNGPWLAQMADGDFLNYLNKKVRPQRAQFRALLRERLAENLTTSQNRAAVEAGEPTPAAVKVADITEEQFADYIRSLRNDRVTLYALVSKFLDLPPLGTPIGFAQSNLIFSDSDKPADKVTESPYGKSGPPPSHPSAGISYLRTGAFMENHAVYGPQAKKTPIQARIVSPRIGASPAKLGVGGFVATVPVGANEFNMRTNSKYRKPLVSGINNLDISTYGGAKAYIEPYTATVDPEGKVVVQVRETSAEAQLVAKEMKGLSSIYNDSELKRTIPEPEPSHAEAPEQDLHQRELESHSGESELQDSRVKQVYDQMLSEEQNVLSNSSSYGLDSQPPSEKK